MNIRRPTVGPVSLMPPNDGRGFPVNPARWIGSSITRRVTAAAVLLTMTIVTGLGAISYVTMRSQIRATIDADLREDADHLALHIERLFSAINENASSLAHNNIVSNALQDPRGRERYLVPFLLSYQLPEHISFTIILRDRRGRVLAGTSPATSQRQVKDPALFEQVVKNGMPAAKLLPGERNNTLLIAYPVYAPSSTGPEGCLVLEILLDDVFERAWRAGSAAQAMNVSLQCCDEVIWEHRTFEEKNTATYSRPLHHLRPPFDDLQFEVMVSEPAATALVPLKNLTLTYSAAGLVILLMTLVLARLLAGRLTGPLVSLTAAADTVTESGSLAVTIDPHGQDEISTLGKAFNTMLSRLREATEGLERRVQERTRDLEHAHQALLAEKAFSDTVIDSLPGVFYIYDEQGRLVRQNKNNERVTGYTTEELCRIPMTDLVPPEEREDLAAKMREVFTAGFAETEVSILSKDGKRTPHFVTGIRAVIDGRPLLIGMGIDITGRKIAEEESRTILRTAMDGFLMTDREGTIIEVNDSLCESLGYHRDELLTMHVRDIEAVHSPEDIRRRIERVFRDGSSRFESSMRRRDGGIIALEVSIHYSPGKGGRLMAFLRDITERKRSEEALRESEEKYRSLIESTSDWIWEIDANGVYTYASPKIMEILGYEPAEVLGRTPFDLMPPEEAVRIKLRVAAIIAARDPLLRLENINRHKDGRLVMLETSAVPIFDRNGRWTGYRGIDRDITERKRSELALEELNRTLQERVREEVAKNLEKDRMMMVQGRQAAMGEMLGNIAHQWRQPLNIVGLIIQDIHDAQVHGQLTPEYLEKNVRRGMDVIQLMSQTIDDFRGFYRKDKEKQTFVLNEIVNRVLSFIAAGFRNNNIAISVKMPEVVEAAGYPNEFAQVLLNILNNARDVLLERRVRSPGISVHVFSDQARSVVTIADNAGGIAAGDLERVFEPFFTTKDEGKGTGIGLYLSKLIIENNMSGRLTARNTAEGAEFRIEL